MEPVQEFLLCETCVCDVLWGRQGPEAGRQSDQHWILLSLNSVRVHTLPVFMTCSRIGKTVVPAGGKAVRQTRAGLYCL